MTTTLGHPHPVIYYIVVVAKFILTDIGTFEDMYELIILALASIFAAFTFILTTTLGRPHLVN
jgi:hypothetical protein